MPVPVPDQALMGSSQDLHCIALVAVTSNRPVVVAVGANQISEYFRVARIGLGTSDIVPVAVARH